jgi:glucose-6-phosphate 1-dehydrogenase
MKTLVFFGASGDLAKEKLFPALYENYKNGFESKYIGYGRSPLSDISFRDVVRKSTDVNDKDFLSKFSYIKGGYDKEGLQNLKGEFDPQNAIYYLAIPNRLEIVEGLITGLKVNGLIADGSQVVIEKPFGQDSESAKKLITLLQEEIGEEKIYPIDHYLAKDLVRNLITLRFANPVFENLWNNKNIKKIDIQIKEKAGIKNRGEYYDRTGAIKDMIQNHGLQLLSLITFNQPSSFDTKDFHKEKEDVLKVTQIFNKSFEENINIGQYKGYRDEEFVDENSTTETYTSINFEVNNERWEGVPINITTGKKLDEKLTSVKIYFSTMQECLWQDQCDTVTQNILTINVYPENNIKFRVNTEFNPNTQLPKSKELRFDFGKEELLNSAYSNALKDIFNNERSYTPSFQEILLSWELIDEITNWLDGRRDKILTEY